MEADLACVDGQIVEESQAVIPVTDLGLLRGDGIFEVCRLYDGVPYALDAHLERFLRSAAGLRLEIDAQAFRADVAALIDAREQRDGMVRIVATRGGRRIVLIEPLPALPAALALEPVTYAPTRLLDGIKSLSYGANMLASRIAREQGADEALLITPHGRVLECPTSSFFLVGDGEVRTPPLTDHVLDSITRRVVISVAEIREESIELASLETAQEAFVAATPYEVRPVARVGSQRYDVPGPLTSQIADAVARRIASELA
ncbi:MAG TPA: aminotransferase class IV [Solirubrobacteraceae bacterium]|nr:aminotransferase class IV [Solirubrobacteraceae bacterium]